MPGATIDGAVIKSGSTIDGVPIKQITVDGAVVWNSEFVLYDNGTENCTITIDVSAGVGTVTKNAGNIYMDSSDNAVGSYAYCTFTSPVALTNYSNIEIYFNSYENGQPADFGIGTAKGGSQIYVGSYNYSVSPLVVSTLGLLGNDIVFTVYGVDSACSWDYATGYIYKIRLY